MDAIRDLSCQYVEEHDLVSAYLAGGLSEDEAEAFEKHYFGCERCWAEVKAGEEIRAALKGGEAAAPAAPLAPSNVRRGPWTSWRVLALAAAVGIVAAGTVVMLKSPPASPLAAVIAAAHSQRRTEARLAGFPYSPVEPVIRGGEGEAKPWKLLKARDDALAIPESKRSPEIWRAIGSAELLLDQPVRAIDTLGKARQRYPQDAHVLSDLSAAQIARWAVTGDARQLEAAFETASKAATLDSSLTEAQFNKALAAQELGYREMGKKEWQRYLTLDSSSGWAQEARRYLQELSQTPLSKLWPKQREELLDAAHAGNRSAAVAIVSRFPDRVRQLVADELLSQWSAADPNAAHSLDSAERIAEVFTVASGDPILQESVAAVRASHPSRLRALREAHSLFGKARSLQNNQSFAHAERTFREAELLLRVAGSPFHLLAAQEVAATAFSQNDLSASLEIGRRIEAEARSRYPAVFARSRWLTGLSEISRGHPAESVRAYSDALVGFEKTNDTETAAFIHSLLAEDYQEMGESALASQHRRQALTALAGTGQPIRRYVALTAAGDAAEEDGQPALARIAFLEAADEGLAAGTLDIVVSALLTLARAEQGAGDSLAASAHLEQAAKLCGAITDLSLRERSGAELRLTEGFVLKSAAAIDSLSAAANFFRKRQDVARLAEIQARRGDLHLASGRPDLARQDFLSGIESVEAERRKLSTTPAERIAFYERSQGLFDRAIALLAETHEPMQAASIVERGRARTLLEIVSGELVEGAPQASVQSIDYLLTRVPLHTVVVEYVALRDRLLAFVFQTGEVHLVTTNLSRERLKTLIQEAGRDLDRRSPVAGGGLEELYAVLIGPLSSLIRNAETIFFAPEKELQQVSFPALRCRETGRYLIEEFAIGVTPSVTIYVRSLERDRTLGRAEAQQRALVISDPRFDSALLPGLKRLRNAAVEARAIASGSADTLILADDAATRARFLAEAPAASLIHFAGHTLLRSDPDFSSLVFAPDPNAGDSGLLYAHEIASLRLTRTRLVVLASCGSASGATRGQEGPLSIARAFLAAGAPAVLASTEAMDDRVASLLLSRFHAAIDTGSDAVSALAEVQRSAIRDPDTQLRRPAAWAFLQIIGGVVPALRKKV